MLSENTLEVGGGFGWSGVCTRKRRKALKRWQRRRIYYAGFWQKETPLNLAFRYLALAKALAILMVAAEFIKEMEGRGQTDRRLPIYKAKSLVSQRLFGKIAQTSLYV